MGTQSTAKRQPSGWSPICVCRNNDFSKTNFTSFFFPLPDHYKFLVFLFIRIGPEEGKKEVKSLCPFLVSDIMCGQWMDQGKVIAIHCVPAQMRDRKGDRHYISFIFFVQGLIASKLLFLILYVWDGDESLNRKWNEIKESGGPLSFFFFLFNGPGISSVKEKGKVIPGP